MQYAGATQHVLAILMQYDLVHTACSSNTVDPGYQAHALVGTIAKIYALHNEVCYITGVKG